MKKSEIYPLDTSLPATVIWSHGSMPWYLTELSESS